MQTYNLDEFLGKYIDNYLLSDLIKIKENIPNYIHPGNAAYPMTGAICAGIELLGSLVAGIKVDPACEACHSKERSSPKSPFNHYCMHYLSKVDPRYKNFGPVLSQLIRNGIAHSFATKGQVGMTRVEPEPGEENHLVRMTQEGFLVVNVDRLFDDFQKSYELYFKPDVAEGGASRQSALEGYEWLKDKYATDILNIEAQTKNKFNDWPLLHPDFPFMEDLVEQVEANGGLVFVS